MSASAAREELAPAVEGSSPRGTTRFAREAQLPKTRSPDGSRRTRRHRGSLSADNIIKGAFEVAEGISLDKLSMTSLAQHLDVGATSIHWYFRKKEDLLNGMTEVAVDKFVRMMPPLTPGKTWQQALREHFEAQRRILRTDTTLADLVLTRVSTHSPDAARRVFELEEALLALLIDQGFTPDNAFHAYNAISVYTCGNVIHDRILRLGNTPTLDSHQRRQAAWESMPILGSLIGKYPLAGTADEDFAFTVGRLICGFEHLLAEQDQAPGTQDRATADR
jgi:AcrR family transcriptional regulator